MAKAATKPAPAAEPEAPREDYPLWDVVNSAFVTESLTEAGRADALAAGTHQDVGDRYLVNGLGQPAPPLALTVTPDAVDWQTVSVGITGGSPAQGSVTIYYGDGTGEHRDGSSPGDISHRYAEPGTYIISVINDYGQVQHAVLTLVEPPPEPPPDPEPEIEPKAAP